MAMSTTLADACLANEIDLYQFVQLHTASPGAAGTTAVAGNSARRGATWSAPVAGAAGFRQITTTADLEWLNVSTSETYTNFSVWSLSSAGVFGFRGTVTANPVTAGDTFTIPLGDLDVTLPIAT